MIERGRDYLIADGFQCTNVLRSLSLYSLQMCIPHKRGTAAPMPEIVLDPRGVHLPSVSPSSYSWRSRSLSVFSFGTPKKRNSPGSEVQFANLELNLDKMSFWKVNYPSTAWLDWMLPRIWKKRAERARNAESTVAASRVRHSVLKSSPRIPPCPFKRT